MTKLHTLHGFGNHHQTEALPNTLPQGQNAPQHVPHGLYTEQLSGTAFTQPRANNQRSWLYRIRPSVMHSGRCEPLAHPALTATSLEQPSPEPMRWSPLPDPTKPTDFIEGLCKIASNGDLHQQRGGTIYLYACNASMDSRYFYSADGEFLFVPQQGQLLCHTELGQLIVEPGEIAVIPRGIKFQIHLLDTSTLARGYVCENHGQSFRLPELGPIGANGLANPRDFRYPTASYQNKTGDFFLISKFLGQLWETPISHSPLDVVAWHGNYAPYQYDLRLFNTINTVSYDHPDPSIFTVLTSMSNTPGMANIDLVIFPERWMVAEHSFRPPYFHRNIMSEFMGLIYGQYDAKKEGFVPGGCSLHNRMSAHGPDAQTVKAATTQTLMPEKYHHTLAFMLESCYPWQITDTALRAHYRQKNYVDSWQTLPVTFKR